MASTDATENVVVCDAGPIIHLDELSCLSLLTDFYCILVPQVVWDEVAQHRKIALHSTTVNFQLSPPLHSVPAAIRTLQKTLTLDDGELHAIGHAYNQDGSLLLTDDMAARYAAKLLNLSVHGTLGILLRAIRRNQMSVSAVVHKLESIPKESTLYVRPSLLREVITAAEAHDQI